MASMGILWCELARCGRQNPGNVTSEQVPFLGSQETKITLLDLNPSEVRI